MKALDGLSLRTTGEGRRSCPLMTVTPERTHCQRTIQSFQHSSDTNRGDRWTRLKSQVADRAPAPSKKKKKKGKGHRHPKVMDYLDQHLWQGSIHLTLTQEIYARQIFDQNVWSSYLRIIYKKWIQINSLQWKQPFSSKKEKKKESQWYKPYSTQTSIKTYSHGTRNQRRLCLL